MSVAKEFEAANANYVASFTKGDLQLPPQRCVDSSVQALTFTTLVSYIVQKDKSDFISSI